LNKESFKALRKSGFGVSPFCDVLESADVLFFVEKRKKVGILSGMVSFSAYL